MGIYQKIKKSIRYWILRNLPACRQTVAMISESMERQLTLRERTLVKVHLWACSWCQWYMEHLQLLRDTLRAQPTEPSEVNFSNAPGLSDEARDRLKRALSSKD